MRASKWFISGLLGVGIVQVASAAAAAEPPVPDAARVVRVTVLLTPSGIRYVTPPTYAMLQESGCRFGTAFHPERQAALLDIMRRYLEPSEAGGFSSGFLRNAIELYLEDGAVLRYMLSDEYDARHTVHGWRDRKRDADDRAPGSMALIAGDGFLRELRAWAGGDVGRVNFNPECLREPASTDAEEIKRALTGPLR